MDNSNYHADVPRSLQRWILFKYVDCTSEDIPVLDLAYLRNVCHALEQY
jgi:chemotaxis methyl-accepting protein methylase